MLISEVAYVYLQLQCSIALLLYLYITFVVLTLSPTEVACQHVHLVIQNEIEDPCLFYFSQRKINSRCGNRIVCEMLSFVEHAIFMPIWLFLLIVLCNNRDRLALFAMYDMEKFDYCTFVSLNHSAPL